MNVKKMLAGVAVAAGLSLAGGAAVTGVAHASASDALLLSTNLPLPRHTAGTTCSKALALSDNPLGKTRWNTVIACHPYITNRGGAAYHWTYIRLDPTTGDLYTSDGWVYRGAVPLS